MDFETQAKIFVPSIFVIVLTEIVVPEINGINCVCFGHALLCTIFTNMLLYEKPVFFMRIYDQTEADMGEFYLIMPIISFAFAFYDLWSGLKLKRTSYIFHGSVFVAMALFFTLLYPGNLQLIYPGLLLESSNVPLNLMERYPKSKFFKVMFAIVFLAYRIFFFPYLCLSYIGDRYDKVFGTIDFHAEKVVVLFMMCGHMLNFYWGWKIVKKLVILVKGELYGLEKGDQLKPKRL